jgi:hypothetical protein
MWCRKACRRLCGWSWCDESHTMPDIQDLILENSSEPFLKIMYKTPKVRAKKRILIENIEKFKTSGYCVENSAIPKRTSKPLSSKLIF